MPTPPSLPADIAAIPLAGSTAADAERLAEGVLGAKRLIVVSNREPYEHVREGGRIVEKRTAGGLVSALDPIMQALHGTWIAWGSGSVDKEVVDERDGVQLPLAKPSYRLRRLWLTPEEVAKFYEGHANQTLWPLFHLEADKVRFLRGEWEAYCAVNERFASAAADEIGEGEAVVWFQDYQFALAPATLRRLRPQAVIAQFWHIPWPPWEIFRQHPQRREMLEGMLGCDLIGMHIGLYCDNFFDCIERELKLPVDREKRQVIVGDRVVRVRPLPISIDAERFDRLARFAQTERLMESLRGRHRLRRMRIGLGVERGDYTKGILLRLRAIDVLLERHPEWRGTFTFLQVSPPSRVAIPAYAAFQREMRDAIRALNAKYAAGDWKPVLYLRQKRPPRELAALYRLADVMVVSAQSDGMNLVAKEYVASHADLRGSLVLSEFAGVSEEMPQAFLINPFDIDAFAESLHEALSLGEPEQERRMRQLRRHLFGNTVYDWIVSLLRELDDIKYAAGHPDVPSLLDHLDDVHAQIGGRKVSLFCDYDGVLTPIAPRPQDAKLEQSVRDLLVKLRDSANVLVSIISGRVLEDLVSLVGIERLTYAGNHGLQISGPRAQIIHPAAESTHDRLRGLYDEMREAMRVYPGVLVEDKQLGIALHYRLADQGQVPSITDAFYKLVERANADRLLRITTGKFVLEARPNIEWDKGRAVLWLLRTLQGPDWPIRALPVYIGDDVTDEDAFRALRRSGVTVLVGPLPPGGTAAQYRLDSPSDVAVFLQWLVQTVQ